jgi:nicotinate phosphoribosyltransferase
MKPAAKAVMEGVLLTDMYQITMAQLYFRSGLHDRPAQFDYFFRSYPDYGNHQAGYCINAGLGWLVEWMSGARFGDADIDCLRSQTGASGARLFGDDFLDWLRRNGDFSGITLRGVPEGRVVHPDVPLAVVRGPLFMAQLLETSLLNKLNYQTLVATKASRVRESGQGRPLLEFGLRRGQDAGANAGARAALIGGADFSSNVGLSCALGYPPKGTHGHSMVQAFMALGEGELAAFRAYARVYPDDCLLLVDTIDTLGSGVPNAIRVFEELRAAGHRPAGIRLDSGDLAYLAVQSARMLDEAGFPETAIVLSNQLDELVVWQIVSQIRAEAGRWGVEPERLINRIVWGVGTRLLTSQGCSALDGVYKLTALEKDGLWVPAIKISESPGKTPNAGVKDAWRIYDRRGLAVADLIGLAGEDPGAAGAITLRHPIDPSRYRTLERSEISLLEPLLADVITGGRPVAPLPSVEEARARRRHDLEKLDEGVKRLVNPHRYHVSLTERLWDLKRDLIRAATGRDLS